ncbi:MAG TPA: GDSL-type esterase/lipase family protein [Thermoanaerobaculia bacterium]|nr:GDSL-type esterase/lipase family protein [Thermoanaerobaculia bacterium]
MRRVLLVVALLASVSARGSVVILGDSVARGEGDEIGRGIAGGLATISQTRVTNLGINGARTANVLRLLSQPATRDAVRRASVVVLSIGGNDLFGSAIERWRAMLAPRLATRFAAARVARVVTRIRRINPSARIILLGLYNPYRRGSLGEWVDVQVARWDSRIIATFATVRAVTVIRITDLLVKPRTISVDRFHPSAAGYRAIAERVWSAIAP